MKFFLLGDFQSDNGPGNANKKILEAMNLRYKTCVSIAPNPISRILEMITGILKSQAVLICSKSQVNYSAIRLAKRFHKPVYYIMHGYASYEAQLNGTAVPGSRELKRLQDYDEFIFHHVDKIICVSQYAMEFMQKKHPQIKERFDFIYNAVSLPRPHRNEARYEKTILSIGAHMRRKQCLPVAKAIECLREQGKDYRLVLVGDKTGEYEAIRHFDFVDWREPMPHEELLQLMAQCPVYIQNSTFDTFALAPVEALYEGASVILSDFIGCKTLFSTLKEEEIIHAPQDVDEIARTIDTVMQNGNHQRLLEGLNEACMGTDWMLRRLSEIFGEHSAD